MTQFSLVLFIFTSVNFFPDGLRVSSLVQYSMQCFWVTIAPFEFEDNKEGYA